jgi:hypothetical protein
MKAFDELLEQIQAQFGSDGHRIASISYDREAFFPNPYNNKMATTDAFITSVNNYFDF